MGFPASVAVATSTAQIPFMAASGTLRYARSAKLDIRAALGLFFPAVVFSLLTSFFIGTFHLKNLPPVYRGKTVLDLSLAGIFCVSIFAIAVHGLVRKTNPKVSGIAPEKKWLKTLATGAALGVFSAMLGIGGGVIAVPFFMYMRGMSANESVAHSLFVILLTSGLTAGSYAVQGMVVWSAALACAAGSIPGAMIGAKWNLTLPGATVKKVFSLFQIFIVFLYAVKVLVV